MLSASNMAGDEAALLARLGRPDLPSIGVHIDEAR